MKQQSLDPVELPLIADLKELKRQGKLPKAPPFGDWEKVQAEVQRDTE